MPPTTVAVLGAGGPTGLEIVKNLSSAGIKVVAIVRHPQDHEQKFVELSGVDLIAGDVSDPEKLNLDDCTAVVFAASASTYWEAKNVDFKGVKNTITAARTHSVEHVILISSRLVNPKHRFHPIRAMLNNIRYSLMHYKFQGEEALRTSSLPYTIVRPGRLEGGHGYKTSRVAGEDYVVAVEAEGDCGKDLSIHRADVASVVVRAIMHPDEAINKTVELVARPRRDGDPSFEDRLESLFKGVPVEGTSPTGGD